MILTAQIWVYSSTNPFRTAYFVSICTHKSRGPRPHDPRTMWWMCHCDWIHLHRLLLLLLLLADDSHLRLSRRCLCMSIIYHRWAMATLHVHHRHHHQKKSVKRLLHWEHKRTIKRRNYEQSK